MDDDNSDVRNDKKEFWETPAFQAIVFLCMVPVYLLFAFYFNLPETGAIASITLALVTIVAAMFGGDRYKYYFWVVVFLFTLAQLPIVLLIPWEKTHLLGVSLLPLGLIDYFVMYGVFKQIKKHFDSNGGNADLF